MELNEIREQIDCVDKELFKAFNERMKLAKCVAQSKLETGDCIYKPEREDIVVSRFSEKAEPDMKKYYEAFIKRVMLISREYQYSIVNDSNKDIKCSNEAVRARTVDVQFVYNGYWPDNIIAAIHDAKSDIINFEKKDNLYSISFETAVSEKELNALLLLIQSESMVCSSKDYKN